MDFKTYLVGGYIRDLLLKKNSNDIDISIESSYDEMIKFIEKKGKILVKNEKFGSIKTKIYGKIIDFAICRKDGFYQDHRRPDGVIKCSIYEDLSRRDFTINAMSIPINLLENTFEYSIENLYDPFNGLDDLKNKIIKCVDDPKKIFIEDPLRIMRAIRFSITLNFSLDEKIKNCLNDDNIIDYLKFLSKERIYEELFKCFKFNTLLTLNELEKYDKIKKFIFSNLENLWLKPTFEKKY